VWSARSEALSLYLSGRTMCIGGHGVEPLRCDLAAEEEWRDVLGDWLARHPRRTWRVALGGGRCSLHWLEPIPGTRSIEEAEAAVAASLGSGSMPVDARLATWSRRGAAPWLAACMPAGLAQELHAMVQAHGRLAALAPWWELVGTTSGLPHAAMCDDESVTYWRSDSRGAVSAAGTLMAPPPAQAGILQRLRVGGPLPRWRLDPAAWERGDAAFVKEEGTDAAAGHAV